MRKEGGDGGIGDGRKEKEGKVVGKEGNVGEKERGKRGS